MEKEYFEDKWIGQMERVKETKHRFISITWTEIMFPVRTMRIKSAFEKFKMAEVQKRQEEEEHSKGKEKGQHGRNQKEQQTWLQS